MLRIYYGDGSVWEVADTDGWQAAPDGGVQAVVRFPQQDGLRWTCNGKAIRDRDLWTGEDTYDPFGWGSKRGDLIADEAYRRIWERACGD